MAGGKVERERRVIAHADLDAFYASVEQRDRPELRGRPVIVGGSREGRGVVLAASYEARASGVHAAMPLRRAARLCPQAVFMPSRWRAYSNAAAQVLEVFRSYTPLVEPVSLDEAFLDVTGCERLFGPPRQLAAHLRRAVRAAVGLPVSVGVAATKGVAKIASEAAKPDGCLVVPPERTRQFLDPLPVRRIWGVGPTTEARLAAGGIHTIGDLANGDLQRVAARPDAALRTTQALARGLDARPVTPWTQAKSVGNQVTFPQDIDDLGLIDRYLQQLTEHVAARLRAKRLAGRTVSVTLRGADFHTRSRQATLEAPTDTAGDIFGAAHALFRRMARPGGVYRLVGVHVSGVRSTAVQQLDLLAPPTRDRRALAAALDTVRQRFGGAAVTQASLLGSSARMDQERYAWRDDVLG